MHVGGPFFSIEHAIGSCAQILAVGFNLVAGSGIIELAGVEELGVAIEEKEIGRAGSAVGFGDILGGIVEVGEIPAVFGGEFRHFFRGVLRVVFDVVGGNGDDSDATILEVAGELSEGIGEHDNEGAVVADKDDEEA